MEIRYTSLNRMIIEGNKFYREIKLIQNIRLATCINFLKGVRGRLLQKATFGMSCFWEPEALFGAVNGVRRTRVGYLGGKRQEFMG